MLNLMRAKMAGTLEIPEGKSILVPSGEGKLLNSKTYDFSIINSPVLYNGRKRHADKIQIRFRVDDIQKIDLKSYLPQFVYFETVSIHLLSLINAKSLDEYYELQYQFRDKELDNRVKELRAIAKSKKIDNIGKLHGLLEVRNEIAHNLYPIAIKYNETTYPYDNKTLVDKVKEDSDKAMAALVQLYELYFGKLEKWLKPILDETPDQVIIYPGGRVETRSKNE